MKIHLKWVQIIEIIKLSILFLRHQSLFLVYLCTSLLWLKSPVIVFNPKPLLPLLPPLFEFPPIALVIVLMIPPLLDPVFAAGYFPPNILVNPERPPSIEPTPELELLVDPPAIPPNNPLNGLPPFPPPSRD